nr:MAG TPA: hypothetical protein [Caudoviricetes sp.]
MIFPFSLIFSWSYSSMHDVESQHFFGRFFG